MAGELTMAGYEGVGLRGGTFSTDGWEVASFRLVGLRWVEDVAVSGRATWDRRTGEIRAAVTLSGPATAPGRLGRPRRRRSAPAKPARI